MTLFASSVPSVVAGVAVGVVLLLAGMLKLAAAAAWTAQARDLGVPSVVARVVPWLELGIGATLAVRVWMPWPAVGAVVLLAAFTVVIVARLAAGQHPPCACFGSWSARPLSWWHVACNVALAGLAVLAATN